MSRTTALAALAPALVLLAAAGCRAETATRSGRFGGVEVQYKVLLPPGYDPARTYPVVLAFTGGGQSLQGAEGTVEADWKPEADRRGYVVISPAAPAGELFFQGGDRVFPAFLDMIRRDFRPAGKLHVAGHSNGGLSAFHVAARWPAYFSTVTGYPGLYQDEPGRPFPAALRSMCLFMHVGDRDPAWRAAMEAQARELGEAGYRVRLTVEKNQVHRLKAAELDLPRRLFDEIESCR